MKRYGKNMDMQRFSLLFRAPLTLSIICMIATGALASLNQATRETIAQVRAQSQLSAFVTLLSRGGDPIQDRQQPELAELKQAALQAIQAGRDVGTSGYVHTEYHLAQAAAQFQGQSTPELYILQLEGRGFGGPLEIYAAYLPGGRVYHAIMLDNSETPGFGKKAEDPSYMKMFWGQGPSRSERDRKIPTSKQELSGAQLDAVTGSTISFSAISTAVLAGADWLAQQKQTRQKP